MGVEEQGMTIFRLWEYTKPEVEDDGWGNVGKKIKVQRKLSVGGLLYLYEELSSIKGRPVRQVQVTPSSNVLEFIAIFEVV